MNRSPPGESPAERTRRGIATFSPYHGALRCRTWARPAILRRSGMSPAQVIPHPGDEPDLLTFLAARSAVHLPMLAALEDGRGIFLGAWDRTGALRGAALLESDGLAYLSTEDPGAARTLGKALARRKIDTLLVDRESGERAWHAMSPFSPPRLLLDQAVYVLEPDAFVPADPPLPLQPAHPDELEEVVQVAKAMFWEEVGLPPYEPTLRANLREEITDGSIFVAREEGTLLFLARVAARCSFGAELQRVFTAPTRRREGIASRALATLCQDLFSSLPRVVLRVNETNQPAMRLYRKLGFSRVGRIRLYCR